MVLAAGFRHNEPARRLFEQLGYRYERTFRLMRIELASGIETPVPPAGIQIRTVDPDRDLPAVHGVLFGAFADHWGGAFDGFEEWRHRSVDGEGASFDPRLWFVAVHEGEIVGAACCIARSPRAADTAVIETLGVVRDRRRRGIARALLLTAFEELARRGIARAELSVDADNTTGATRLYERVGMRVAYVWDFWRKDVTASA
jgi:GNAT superfamily N-acetyltransferase